MDENAYSAGFAARLAGETTDANPYKSGTERFFDWADGWKDQDHHLTERDKALDSIGWFG